MYKKFKKYSSRKINSLKTLKDLYTAHPDYAISILKKKSFMILEKIYLLFLLPIVFPLLIGLRIIKPFFVIRLGNLESEGIGHFSQPVEIYLSELDCGVHKNKTKTIDVWYLNKIICNQFLLSKWKEIIFIAPRYIRFLHLLNNIIPGGQANEIPYRRSFGDRKVPGDMPWQMTDCHRVLERTKPHIKFSVEERQNCMNLLLQRGFDINDKYVCINVRDGAFHQSSGVDAHRNSSINEYHDAIDCLIELGYQVVRLGAKVEESLNKEGPLIFDYATSGIRSDILDIFLISECSFLIGVGGAGLDVVASLFRKRQLYLNVVELRPLSGYPYNSILIFQKYKKGEREIPLSSICNYGYHNYSSAIQYTNSNIELIKNSKKEIRGAILEMHLRHIEKWKNNELDERNQNLFLSIYPDENFSNLITSRVGSEFLRENKTFLS